MLRKLVIIVVIVQLMCIFPCLYAMENLLYMLRNQTPITLGSNSLIQILAPQAFQINENGSISGNINPQIIQFSQKNNTKLMPLVTNASFSRTKTHHFLMDTNAQDRALNVLLSECQKNNFYGLQIDFENMSVSDKSAFTTFYLKAAKLLHDNHFAISLAMVPAISDQPPATIFLRARYEHWTGVYDYKAIGEASDFVTLMTYDQHIDNTTPGPVASLPWVEAGVKYALQFIPRYKISLGIPTYSAHWKSSHNVDEKITNSLFTQIGYKNMRNLITRHHGKLQWDNYAKVPYGFYERNWLYEYIFAEDERSFKAKLNLVNKYNLRGISIWRLGLEDPNIWQALYNFKYKSRK